jgi:Ti-type conjugative transfer relaxase TraA
MIPRLSERSERKDGRGRSFRDLSSYLFVGSMENPDPSRVNWAETLNCHASDPSQAWHEMAWTWQHSDSLKTAAGVRRGGQRNEVPVWHVSLNWRDDQAPTRAQMMDAANSLLNKFGLEGHQALAVAHGDTGHPHLHLMVNTVDPFDGRTVDVSKSTRYRLSAWALNYERENGVVLCEQRERNWQARSDNKAIMQLTAAAFARHDLDAPIVPKTYGKADSRSLWAFKQEAKAAGVSPDGVDRLGALHKAAWRSQYEHEARAAQTPPDNKTPEAILRRLTRSESTFTRQQLAQAVNEVTSSSEEFSTILARIEGGSELMASPQTPDRYSTKTIVTMEREMIEAAEALCASYRHSVRGTTEDVGCRLSAEQKAALQHVTDAHGLACVVGYAGSGKSTMLADARKLWEASGYIVRGVALSGIAAENLEGGSGIASTTLHALQWSIKGGAVKLSDKDVIVLDEAGMVGSRMMHGLLTAAREAGAKVVLVGDPEQLQAIDAGGAFRAILEKSGAAHITTVRRQQEAWQQVATRNLADGKISDALTAYADRGHLRAHADKASAVAGLVREWSRDLEGTASPALILAATRKDVAALNAEARTAMRQAGRLGQDIVIPAREESLEQPMRSFKLRVAEGERLLFTKNDRRMGVKNGTLGTLVLAEGKRLRVRLDGPERRLIEVNLDQYQNLAHGYALTIHKSQGCTTDKVAVLAGRSMDKHSTYVALSRHRKAVTVHYSQADARDVSALARRLSRERPKGTSLEHFGREETDRRVGRSIISRSLSMEMNRAAAVSKTPDRFREVSHLLGKGISGRDMGRER